MWKNFDIQCKTKVKEILLPTIFTSHIIYLQIYCNRTWEVRANVILKMKLFLFFNGSNVI